MDTVNDSATWRRSQLHMTLEMTRSIAIVPIPAIIT